VKTVPTIAIVLLIVAGTCTAQEPVAADLDSDFAAFVQEYKAKAVPTLGPESVATWTVGSVYISRLFISQSVAETFNKANVTVRAVFPKQSLNPQPPSFNLVMPHIIKNCDPPCGSCDGGGLGRLACEAGRTTCIATTRPIVDACLVAKAALDAWAGSYLGHVDPYDIELQANMSASALQLAIPADLSRAEMTTNLNVHGIVQGHANVDLTSLAGAFTACWPHQSMTIPATGVAISSQQFTAVAPFTLTPMPDGVQISTAIQQISFDLTFDGNPLISVLKDNPQVYISCTLPAGAFTTLGIVNYFMPLKETESFTPDQVTTVVGKITLDIPGSNRKTTLQMVAPPLSIGVTEAPSLAATSTSTEDAATHGAPSTMLRPIALAGGAR
jgi:hypothetical protein